MNFHTAPHIYTGEVHLNVLDLTRSVRFYKEVVGFKELEATADKIILTADGKTPLLIIEQPAHVTPKMAHKSGLYHFALLLPKRANLGAIIKHLIQQRVQLGASDHLVSEALYLSDPDGNGIEIYTDRDPANWRWDNGNVMMQTDPLDADSIIAESGEQTWDGLPVGTIMGHVHLHVSNLPETEVFYNALGFEVVANYPQALFMSNGQYHHHLGLNTWNGVGASRPAEGSVGLQSFTLVYPTEEVLNEALAKVEALKVKVVAKESAYHIEDPSGNRIILRLG